MKRAIVIYLEDNRNLMMMFGCLYTSYKYIEPKDTDLVVFGTPAALSKVPDDCIKVECQPASDLPDWYNYRYINSISCLTGENSDFLDKYDLLLRSDVDVFLTPAWNTFYPDLYTTGEGGYVNDEETKANLKRIAGIFGLKHKGIHNIGSTHYGYAPLVREVCKMSMKVAHHIFTKEFPPGEEGTWPGWYKGVTTMYSNEIAVNGLVEHVRIAPTKLDYYSTSENSVHNHPHIHCWHTDNMFSKFWFWAGRYDDMPTDNLDLDKIRDYCLYMALKSRKEMPWLSEL